MRACVLSSVVRCYPKDTPPPALQTLHASFIPWLSFSKINWGALKDPPHPLQILIINHHFRTQRGSFLITTGVINISGAARALP